MENEKTTLVRVRKSTWRKIRQLAANTDEMQMDLIERLVTEELKRIEEAKQTTTK